MYIYIYILVCVILYSEGRFQHIQVVPFRDSWAAGCAKSCSRSPPGTTDRLSLDFERKAQDCKGYVAEDRCQQRCSYRNPVKRLTHPQLASAKSARNDTCVCVCVFAFWKLHPLMVSAEPKSPYIHTR